MPHIQALEKHVAELIAAGEVVERPASVVKELVENCVDAGASAVAVSIRRGGMGMIRVSDDGCGIAPAELPTAFLRHATSKLRTAGDLAGVETLGFRGEALAAISAVSRVEIVTREREAATGSLLRLEGGVPGEVEEIGAPEGTTITVSDLFFNTPARLKFMKKDSAETAAVGGLMQHLALSHPEISFRFTRDGTDALHTPGDGKLESAIYAALGREFASTLIPVQGRGGEVGVSGFVTRPLSARGSRSMQTFFVNGRFIKSQLLTAALEEAYRNQMMKGKFPGCVLSLTLPAALVDVNVHPAKTQVKFAREHDLFDAVYHTVLDTLASLGSPIPAPGMGTGGYEHAVSASGADGGPMRTGQMNSGRMYSGSLAAASRQDFFQNMDAKTYREQGGRASREQGGRALREQGGRALREQGSQTSQGKNGKPDTVAPSGRTPLRGRGTSPQAINASLQSLGIPACGIAVDAAGFDEEGDRVQPLTPEHGRVQEPGRVLETAPEWEAPVEQEMPSEQKMSSEQKMPSEQEMPLEQKMPPVQEIAVEQGTEQAVLPAAAEEIPWRITGEILRTYIVCESGEGDVWLIDKHAAHERVNFDRLLASSAPPMRQTLLTPVAVNPGQEDAALLLENLPLLEKLGFSCEDFGDGTILAREIPADLSPGDAAETLEELAADLRTGRNPEERRERILRTVACKASIKGGWESNPQELRVLVDKVQRGEIRFCPHGRPVAVKLNQYDLEKMFKRA